MADQSGLAYEGKIGVMQVARILAYALGHWGSSAQYLYLTVSILGSLGVRHSNLWAIQTHVAERISGISLSSFGAFSHYFVVRSAKSSEQHLGVIVCDAQSFQAVRGKSQAGFQGLWVGLSNANPAQFITGRQIASARNNVDVR